jgi:hypothetical protein
MREEPPMTRYRVTRKDNPSDRFEDDADDVLISDGDWMLVRNATADTPGAPQTLGAWAVHDHVVEAEQHGGTWRELDPARGPAFA